MNMLNSGELYHNYVMKMVMDEFKPGELIISNYVNVIPTVLLVIKRKNTDRNSIYYICYNLNLNKIVHLFHSELLGISKIFNFKWPHNLGKKIE